MNCELAERITDISSENNEGCIIEIIDGYIDDLEQETNTRRSIDEERQLAENALAAANETSEKKFLGIRYFSRKKAIENTRFAQQLSVEAQLKSTEIQDKLFENDKRIIQLCRQILATATINIATCNASILYLEEMISDGSKRELSDDTKEQVINVLHELKDRKEGIIRIGQLETSFHHLEDGLNEQRKMIDELRQNQLVLMKSSQYEDQKDINTQSNSNSFEKHPSLWFLTVVSCLGFLLGLIAIILACIST